MNPSGGKCWDKKSRLIIKRVDYTHRHVNLFFFFFSFMLINPNLFCPTSTCFIATIFWSVIDVHSSEALRGRPDVPFYRGTLILSRPVDVSVMQVGPRPMLLCWTNTKQRCCGLANKSPDFKPRCTGFESLPLHLHPLANHYSTFASLDLDVVSGY